MAERGRDEELSVQGNFLGRLPFVCVVWTARVVLLAISGAWHTGWPSLIPFTLGCAAYAGCSAFLDRRQNRLTLRDGVVAGPPHWGLFKRSIALRDLDRVRSLQPTRWGTRVLRAKNGEAITLSPVIFSEDQRRAILRAVGLA